MLLRKDAGAVWVSIIFSDAKKWNLDGTNGFQHYWRDLHLPARQTKRSQAGGGLFMVWGAFSALGKSNLVVLVARQNSEDYIHTVSENLLPFVHLNHGTDFTYQQDNASIHVSKSSIEFFNENVLNWKVYANGRQFDSVQGLTLSLMDEWESFRVKFSRR
uniref:GK10162 putative n=1 Tax=Albugo laibachii Nc14 TaxID=890382 RepID=F0WCE5_9STRA|nr:GK10162 putative [Albugo laibachii Nc14]|eukprot:CCA18860.1 GK10162 putative [Albugo laibachii Nc14]